MPRHAAGDMPRRAGPNLPANAGPDHRAELTPVTVLLPDRPSPSPSPAATERPATGGAPARRAVIRWGGRLFRREWRRHVLILAMLTVAVAATIIGLGTATNAVQLGASPQFGTASTVITINGSDPSLAQDLAAIRARVGRSDVIAHQQVAVPGSVSTIDIRDQAPGGIFDRSTLRLDSGRYPSGADQVAVTSGTAQLFALRVGGTWTVNGRTRQVVGIVENPLNLLDDFALVAPGQAAPPATVSILTDWQPHPGPGERLPAKTALLISSRGQPSTASVEAVVLALGTLGLLFVGLMAVAGFTVMAQRRLRALGMLASLGATDRNVRLVMLADGAAVGVTGAVTGGVVGVVGWLAFAPTLQSISGHRIDRFGLPWPAVGLSLVLAAATAVVAAWWPARAVTRTSVVTALSGRPPRPQPAHRFTAVGAALLSAGLAFLYFSDHGTPHNRPVFIILGTLITPVGLLFLAPLAIHVLARVAPMAGVGMRLALRDLLRYQARSGAALASVTLAVAIAATIAVSASATETPNALPNLPTDQLMLYTSPSGGGNPVPPLSASQLQTITNRLDQLATALHARTVSPLEEVYRTGGELQPAQPGPGGHTLPPGYASASLSQVNVQAHGIEISSMTALYVATPALLAQFGIDPAAIRPDTDVLTNRTDLGGTKIFSPDFGAGNGPTPGATPGPTPGSGTPPGLSAGTGSLPGAGQAPGSGPGADRLSAQSAVTPKTQVFPELPRYPSAPGTLLTESALGHLDLTPVPAAWWFQLPAPLTAQQIQTARAAAATLGLFLETTNRQSSLAPLRNWSTAAGILLALGVLGMSVGLIRSETAGDLGTLAATGASSGTRRTITAATGGALALLGAVLGTAGAYAALTVWYHHDLSVLGRVPVANLVVILVGLPVLAAAGGWALAGRQPAAMARSALE